MTNQSISGIRETLTVVMSPESLRQLLGTGRRSSVDVVAGLPHDAEVMDARYDPVGHVIKLKVYGTWAENDACDGNIVLRHPLEATSTDDAHTRGLLDARRAYAQVWADVTNRVVHEVDFTTQRFRDELRSRWFERRSLADGTPPAVGQRVVTVRDVAESWRLAHAHDDYVHEITSLLGGDTHLVECGPKQIGVAMLQLAPAGSDVTCPQCLGWHEQRERWRIDAEAHRQAQARAEVRRELIERLVAALDVAYPGEPPQEARAIIDEALAEVRRDG